MLTEAYYLLETPKVSCPPLGLEILEFLMISQEAEVFDVTSQDHDWMM